MLLVKKYSKRISFSSMRLATGRICIGSNSWRLYNTVSSDTNNNSVSDFYAGKSVFITGGTGFLGKVFIEKLLYSCKDIKNIYVLIRAKNDDIAKQRIQHMVTKPLFKRLKRERPADVQKIVPIIGDICASKLGIKEEDRNTLIEKVSVVFHTAATTQFNEPLRVALNINVEGTWNLLNLCKRMKYIQAFVHISTAYCNVDKNIIDEMVYPPPVSLSKVYEHIEEHGDDDEAVKKILNGRPNTYTFTKALAETLVVGTHEHVPTVIIRPSIVNAALKEPLSGWVDTMSAATALMIASARGMTRVVVGDSRNLVDLIPVDYVTNLSLVAASRCKSTNEVSVYNSCTSECNPLTITEMFSLITKWSYRHGFNVMPWPGIVMVKSRLLVTMLSFLMQTAPAHVADLLLRVRGDDPRFVKRNKRSVQVRQHLDYFTSHSWQMTSHRARALAASLSTEDQREFYCDPSDIVWDKHLPLHMHGVKRHILEEIQRTKDMSK